MNKYFLRFKFTVSRGRNSFGYPICTLYVNGKRVVSTVGGGYDLQGTVLAVWLMKEFPDRLYKIRERAHGIYDVSFVKNGRKHGHEWKTITSLVRPDALYGLSWRRYGEKTVRPNKDLISLDGACGFDSMKRIAEAIGISIEFLDETNSDAIYLAREIGVSNRTVTVEVSGGVATNVLGLPEGWDYTVHDYDDDEAREKEEANNV